MCIVLSHLQKTNKNIRKTEIANKHTVHLNLIINRMAAKNNYRRGGNTHIYIHSIYIYVYII